MASGAPTSASWPSPDQLRWSSATRSSINATIERHDKLGLVLSRGAVIACALAQSACFALAVGNTHDQVLTSAVVETRVTSQQADVDGTLCYIDQLEAVTIRRRISEKFFAAAAGEAVVGGVASLFGSPWWYAGLPIFVDGLMTLVYQKAVNRKVVSRRRWQLSNDTGPCRR